MRYKRLICNDLPHPSEINAIAVVHNNERYIMHPQKMHGYTKTSVGMWGKLYICERRLSINYALLRCTAREYKEGIYLV